MKKATVEIANQELDHGTLWLRTILSEEKILSNKQEFKFELTLKG